MIKRKTNWYNFIVNVAFSVSIAFLLGTIGTIWYYELSPEKTMMEGETATFVITSNALIPVTISEITVPNRTVLTEDLSNDALFMSFFNSINPLVFAVVDDVSISILCSPNSGGCYNTETKVILVMGSMANDVIKWSSYHELAHYVWHNILNESERQEYIAQLNYSCNDPITGYSRSDIQEDFADSIAEYYYDLPWYSIAPMPQYKQEWITRIFVKHGLPVMGTDFNGNYTCNCVVCKTNDELLQEEVVGELINETEG